MTELKTWAGRSSFRYSGSVEEGTKIFIYSGYAIICERYHKDPLPLSRGCYKRKRILTYTVCFTGACGTQLYDVIVRLL